MFGKPKPPALRDIDPELRRRQADITLGWWKKNLKWVLLFGPGLFSVMLVLGGWYGLQTVKSSPVYVSGWEQVRESAEVKKALGQPIDEGFWAQGQMEGLGAVYVFNVKGPNGTATVQHTAERASEQSSDWQTVKLQVFTQTDLGNETITLVGEAEE
ncbi:hypothetical protein JD969_11340 [Planctomycetota bacterium]|nr:hypothetical protein JD969_11340 [Planctomycetota bacterium]